MLVLEKGKAGLLSTIFCAGPPSAVVLIVFDSSNGLERMVRFVWRKTVRVSTIPPPHLHNEFKALHALSAKMAG